MMHAEEDAGAAAAAAAAAVAAEAAATTTGAAWNGTVVCTSTKREGTYIQSPGTENTRG